MGARPPTPSLGARLRAIGFHVRLILDDIGTAALTTAGMLAVVSLIELIAIALGLIDDLETGGDLGDATVGLYLASAGVAALMLVGVLLGTWLRSVWTIRAVVVVRLLGVVLTLSATGMTSVFAVIGLLLALALWLIAEKRWNRDRVA